MKRIFLLATIVAAATASTASATTPPRFGAYVNDQFKIGVTLNNRIVKSLKAGRYTLIVNDSTSNHNFHLMGPGVNKATSVAGKGTYRWTITLRRGTYRYVCDPHASFMKGSFTVS
jgi:plastocyanin